jgi:hypothetical protein
LLAGGGHHQSAVLHPAQAEKFTGSIFDKPRLALHLNYQVLPIMVFVDIAEEDYVNIIKSADVEDISV